MTNPLCRSIQTECNWTGIRRWGQLAGLPQEGSAAQLASKVPHLLPETSPLVYLQSPMVALFTLYIPLNRYDGLLMQNQKLRKELLAANNLNKDRERHLSIFTTIKIFLFHFSHFYSSVGNSIIQIQTLEHRLLNMAEKVVDYEGKIRVVYNKYLRLKSRKDEREFALKKSIESLQVRNTNK